MADVFVSPGVYTQEIDDTFVPAGAGTIGAALIGRTASGPAFRPIRVNNFNEFNKTFGGLSPSRYMPYAAKAYLRNGSPLTVVRVLGKGTVNAGQVGAIAFPTIASANGDPVTSAGNQTSVSALSGSNTVFATVRRRTAVSALDNSYIQMSGFPNNFSLYSNAAIVHGLSIVEGDAGYLPNVLGTDPEKAHPGDLLNDLYVDGIFNYGIDSNWLTNCVSGIYGSAGFVQGTGGQTNGVSITADGDMFQEVTGGFSGASTPLIVSQNFSGTVHPLFKFQTLSDGSETNNKYKIAISHVDMGASSTAYPKFTVAVRDSKVADTDPSGGIDLEVFTDVNLDHNSKNYIARVIGDRSVAFDLTQDPPEILYNGDYPNRSQYVRVIMSEPAPAVCSPRGFQGVSSNLWPASGGAEVPTSMSAATLALTTTQINSKTSAVDENIFLGVANLQDQNVKDRLKRTNTSASGDTQVDHGMLILATVAEAVEANVAAITNSYRTVNLLTVPTDYTNTNKVRFTAPMFGGWDGFDPRKDPLVTEVSTGTDTLSGDFATAIQVLANPDEVDFNLIAMPGIHSSAGGSLTDRLVSMCSTRADAFAILDIADSTATGSGLGMSIVNAQSESAKFTSNYGATYYPWVRVNDIDNDKLVWVPPSVAAMGAYAFNDRVAQPWFAPAGFNRGGLESVLEVRRRLTQSQRDALYNSNINPIATFPVQGIVIFGQKTLQKKQSVLDRINVRRMMIEVRKTIAGFSRLFIFEPNSVATRERLLTQVNDYLASVQAANGLNEFRAVLDETTTTPDLIDRNIIKGKIFLKPTTAAEIVLFDFTVTPNGAAFSE